MKAHRLSQIFVVHFLLSFFFFACATPFNEIFTQMSPLREEFTKSNEKLINDNNFIIYHYFANYIYPIKSLKELETNYYWANQISSFNLNLKSNRNPSHININIACIGGFDFACFENVIKLDNFIGTQDPSNKIFIYLAIDSAFYGAFSAAVLKRTEVIKVEKVEKAENLLEVFKMQAINLPYFFIDYFIQDFPFYLKFISQFLLHNNNTVVLRHQDFFLPLSIPINQYVDFIIYLQKFQYDAMNHEKLFQELENYFTPGYMNFQKVFFQISFNAIVYKMIATKEYLNQLFIIIQTDVVYSRELKISNISNYILKMTHFKDDFKYLEWKHWSNDKKLTQYFHESHVLAYKHFTLRKKNLIIGVIWNHTKYLEFIQQLLISVRQLLQNNLDIEFVILIPQNEIDDILKIDPKTLVKFVPFHLSQDEINNNNRFLLICSYLEQFVEYKNVIVVDIGDIVLHNDPFHLLPQDNYFLVANHINLNIELIRVYNTGFADFFGESTAVTLTKYNRFCAGTIGGDYYSIILLGYLINELSSQARYNQIYWIFLSNFRSAAYKIYKYPNGFLFYRIAREQDQCDFIIKKQQILLKNYEIPAILHQVDNLKNIEKSRECWQQLEKIDVLKPFFKKKKQFRI